MRKILIVWVVLWAITISFADGLCVQFCVDCSRNPAGASCAKIDQVCGNCPAILDSIRQDSISTVARADSIKREKEIRDSLQKEDVGKLAELLANNCKSDTCNFEVTVNDGLLGHVRGKKGNNVVKVDSAVNSIGGRPLLPAMSDECQSFCGMCSEQGAQADSMCVKIETQCRCKAYAEQERLLAEKVRTDSVAAVEKALAREDASQKVSNGIFGYCTKKPAASPCSLSVNLLGEKFSAVKILDLSSGKEIAVVVDTVKLVVVEEPKADTLADTAMVTVNEPRADTAKSDTLAPKQAEERVPTVQKFYKGVSIAMEMFNEKEVANYRVNSINRSFFTFDDGLSTDHIGVSLGFLLRWYLYRYGSFQTGLNVLFHHGDYTIDEEDLYIPSIGHGNGEIDYYTIMAEIPLQFRFGIPLGKIKDVSPFVSVSTHIRKPIYAWINHYYADWEWTARTYDYYNDQYYNYSQYSNTSYNYWGEASYADWEFVDYLGIGLELYRHVTIQWQILVASIRTNVSEIEAYDTGIDTWRLNLDVAW